MNHITHSWSWIFDLYLTGYLMSDQMTICFTSDKDNHYQWKRFQDPCAMKLPCNVADVICYLDSDRVVEIVKESAIYFASSVSDTASSSPISINKDFWQKLAESSPVGGSGPPQINGEGPRWKLTGWVHGAWIFWEFMYRVTCFATY